MNSEVSASEIGEVLSLLAGQKLPNSSRLKAAAVEFGEGPKALGHSQLNELLLLCELDRVHRSFFNYLLTGTDRQSDASGFESLDELRQAVLSFRRLALLEYGNVKFAFKTLSTNPTALQTVLEKHEPLSPDYFEARHDHILPIVPIAPEDAYLTGYIVERMLKERLTDACDSEAKELWERREEIVATALQNQEAYYASDHMDVYVATSMRQRHEFVAIHKLAQTIFEHPQLKPLKLRWFDPTQARCANRIDKGLAEALMLKRAMCTIYLVQAADTLGKDSELASTLAQGKPVIAYVPEVDETFLEDYFLTLLADEPSENHLATLLEQLQVHEPSAAWTDPEVRDWIEEGEREQTLEKVKGRLSERVKTRYDQRAKTLQESHPLAIQVNLQEGVANGVLVARTPEECSLLVKRIATKTLEFRLDETDEHYLLREAITNSIFRVMTKDEMLTNTFWNFYLY